MSLGRASTSIECIPSGFIRICRVRSLHVSTSVSPLPPCRGGRGGVSPPGFLETNRSPPGFPPWAQPGSAEGGASKTTQQAVSRSQIVQKQRGNACRDTKIPQNFPAAPSGAANGLNPLILIFRSPLRSTIPPLDFWRRISPPGFPPWPKPSEKTLD